MRLRANPLILIAFAIVPLLAQRIACPDMLERGRQAYEGRQFQIAIAEFERALAACPQRPQILLAMGQAQLMAGRVDAGIHSLEEAAKLDPKNILTQKVLGDALY